MHCIAGPINDTINCIFTVEAAMRVVAQGFMLGKHAYLRSRWNVFDLVLISMIWVMWMLAWTMDIPDRVSHIVSILRSFRVLRFFKHIRQMLMALNTSLPMLLVICYGLGILFVVFGVLFHALFNGALTHICWDQADVQNCSRCVSIVDECPAALRCGDDDLQCYLLQRPSALLSREDHTDKYGFDNAGQSALTMFSMATLDDWQGFSNSYRKSDSVHAKTSLSLGAFVITVSLTGVNFLLAAIS